MPSRSFSSRSGAPARANSSASTTCSIGERPAPPYSFGQDTATRPRTASDPPPLPREGFSLSCGQRAGPRPAGRQVLAQEGADPLAESFRLGWVRYVHCGSASGKSASGSPLGGGQDLRCRAPVVEPMLDCPVRQFSAGDFTPVRMVELMDLEASVQRRRETHGVDGLVHRFLDQQAPALSAPWRSGARIQSCCPLVLPRERPC